jgi:transposase
MKKNTAFVGFDVHVAMIYVAIALSGRDGEVRSLGSIPHRPESIRKLIKKLQKQYKEVRVCYEAGPCGYTIYWQLTMKLAQYYRSGDLTPVWVPDRAHEALRDLVRAREAAVRDQRAARNRLGKFLIQAFWGYALSTPYPYDAYTVTKKNVSRLY